MREGERERGRVIEGERERTREREIDREKGKDHVNESASAFGCRDGRDGDTYPVRSVPGRRRAPAAQFSAPTAQHATSRRVGSSQPAAFRRSAVRGGRRGSLRCLRIVGGGGGRGVSLQTRYSFSAWLPYAKKLYCVGSSGSSITADGSGVGCWGTP